VLEVLALRIWHMIKTKTLLPFKEYFPSSVALRNENASVLQHKDDVAMLRLALKIF
jgi:hypothetical protein